VLGLALTLILTALSRIVWTLLWASLALRHKSKFHSPFSRRLITRNFSSTPPVFRRFFTLIALCDADLRFSLILIRKANAVKEQTKRDAAYITKVINVIRVTDGVTVTSLPASLLQNVTVTTDRLWKIALKRRLSRKFEENCIKFQVALNRNSAKLNRVKREVPEIKYKMTYCISSVDRRI
jgi:hypothetical protein